MSLSDDFAPTASWENLRRRAELLRRLREFFLAAGFLEVETPLLSADVVVDRHLDPLSVILPDDPAQPDVGRPMWLQTSPEAGMKRLMAAGEVPSNSAIYQVTRSFRAGERGRLHNPEFTIVEWYRRGDSMDEGMRLLSDVCEALLDRGPAQRISYAEAFGEYAGVDPHRASADELAAAVRSYAITPPSGLAGEDRDGWLDLLLVSRVQPRLGKQRPTILFDFPASQAALARVRREDPPVAERFELYAGGVELANGYHELTDAEELRRRFAEQNTLRVADGKPPLPLPARLLAAMDAGLPDCTGVALGFDRVVMLAAGSASIDEVITYPIERA